MYKVILVSEWGFLHGKVLKMKHRPQINERIHVDCGAFGVYNVKFQEVIHNSDLYKTFKEFDEYVLSNVDFIIEVGA